MQYNDTLPSSEGYKQLKHYHLSFGTYSTHKATRKILYNYGNIPHLIVYLHDVCLFRTLSMASW